MLRRRRLSTPKALSLVLSTVRVLAELSMWLHAFAQHNDRTLRDDLVSGSEYLMEPDLCQRTKVPGVRRFKSSGGKHCKLCLIGMGVSRIHNKLL